MGKYVRMRELPKCDFCREEGSEETARYDAKTRMGPWAYMCPEHFDMYTDRRLGTGVGQYLLLHEEELPNFD